MLGRRTRDARNGTSVTETFIGKGTRIEGTVVAEGALRIEGEVVGEIHSKGDVFIAETGDVKANVKAVNLTVSGQLTGTATVTERLELLHTGKMLGDATMKTLIVEQGGLLEGNCNMRVETSESSTARTKAPRLESAG